MKELEIEKDDILMNKSYVVVWYNKWVDNNKEVWIDNEKVDNNNIKYELITIKEKNKINIKNMTLM